MKNILLLVSVLLLLGYSCKNENQKDNCLSIIGISQKVNNSFNYKLNSINFSNHRLYMNIQLKEMDFYVPQIEREFVFYSLANSIHCTNADLDSVVVQINADSISEQNLIFNFNYRDILFQLNNRDSLGNNAYSRVMNYLLKGKNYRLISIILISYFGDVIHKDTNGMHTDVDFFNFLLKYTTEVNEGNSNLNLNLLLQELKIKISHDPGLHLDIKKECLDFIKYIEETGAKNQTKST